MSNRRKDKTPERSDIPDGVDVVGTRNDARLAYLAEIADSADRKKVEDDGMELNNDPGDEQEEEEEETEQDNAPDVSETREEIPDDDDETSNFVDKKPEKHKIKVNGKELELTLDEIIARAQKVEAADEYLRQAAERAKQVNQPVEPEINQQEIDDLALARALQMGTEAEAVQAIRKLRTAPSTRDELPRLVDERLAFQHAAEAFQKEFPDICSDPKLMSMVIEEDAKLVNAGDRRPYLERYRAIGEDIKNWRNGLQAVSKKSEKAERKAQVIPIKQAQARATAPVEDDNDEDPREVIAKMAKARGQR